MNTNMRYNSVTLLLSFIIITIITALKVNPFVAVISLCGAVSFMIFCEGFIKSLMKLFACFIFAFVFTFINPLISHMGDDVLFYVNSRPYTLQALFYGFVFSMMMSAVFIWFYNVSVLIGSDSMIGLFGRLFPKLSLVLSMSLSVLPMYIKSTEEINDSSRTLGMNGKNLFSRMKSIIHTFKAVIMTMPENVIEKSLYMNCRGFGTRKYRSFLKDGIRLKDIIAIILYVSSFLFICISDGMDFEFYPTFDFNFDFRYYLLFAVMVFLPTAVLFKEKLLKNKARSHIDERVSSI